MSAAILFSIVFCALIFGFVGLLENSDEYLLISYSFVAAVPTSIAAFVWQRKDPFSPMNLLNFIVIFSIPLYCVYINFVADHGKIERKLYGLEVVDLYPGITLVLIGVVFLIFGFFSIGSIAKRRTRYVMRSRSLFSRVLLISILILLSGVAGYLFARDVGLFQSIGAGENLVAKRVHEATQGVAPRGSALTHWRVLGYELPHAFLIAYMSLIWRGWISGSFIEMTLVFILYLVSLIIPFFAGTRTAIFEVVMLLIMIRHYMVRPQSFFRLGIIAIVGLFAVGLLGQMRQVDPGERAEGLKRYLGVFEEIVGASYFMEPTKNTIIVREVPENVDHLYGESLTSIFKAVIPRQLWPDKPIVRIGYFVGQDIFVLRNQSGIPPGFIAELYLNFGYWFVPIPMMLLGIVLRFAYNSMLLDATPMRVIVYSVSTYIVLLSLLPADLTFGLYQAAVYFVLIYVFYNMLCSLSMQIRGPAASVL